MIDYFLISKILIILINVFGLWLALFVYLSNQKSKANQLFLIMVIFALLWITLCYFGNAETENLNFGLFLARLAYGITILFFIPFFYFFSLLTQEKSKKILNFFIPSVSILIFFLSVFTDFIAIEMTPAKIAGINIGIVPILGEGKFLYFGFVFLISILVITKILKKYLTESPNEKLKLQYFLLGILIFIIFNLIFNVILAFGAGDARYYQIGNYSIIFFLALTAYAIVKRELFEIKVVLTGILVSAISILLIVDVFFFTETTPAQILKTIALVVFLAFGYYLIKSVNREIRQREELQKLATELEKANTELKKLDVSKTEFISIASHQLRTPLTAIKGYLSMVNDGTYGKLPDIAKEKIKNVFESNERLIRLVNDLLNVSRIETGKMGLEKNEIKVEDFIHQIAKDLAINAKKKKLYLKFTKPKEKLPKISVDESKLRQVILNIVDNAIKYTNKGGITISAEKTKDNFILIEITDTGEGMDEQDLSKIFERFSRGNAGNWMHAEGAGLGLYIAKQFTEMHNGKIWAESEGEGKGSKFCIKLPIG